MSIKQRLKKRTFNKYNNFTDVEWEIFGFISRVSLGVQEFSFSLGTHWQPIERQTWG